MKTMIGCNRTAIKNAVVEVLASWFGFDYVQRVLATGNLMDDIVQNIVETSGQEFEAPYNDDDVRHVVDRVLTSRFINPGAQI